MLIRFDDNVKKKEESRNVVSEVINIIVLERKLNLHIQIAATRGEIIYL